MSESGVQHSVGADMKAYCDQAPAANYQILGSSQVGNLAIVNIEWDNWQGQTQVTCLLTIIRSVCNI